MISLRVKSYNRGTKKRSGCCRFTLLWGESHFYLSQHELKSSFFKNYSFFAAKPALSQCETVLLQYVYSFKVYSTEKSPTIYCTGLRFTCLFTANDLVPSGLSIYIYIIQVTAIYSTHHSLRVHSASKNQIMVASVPVLTRKVNTSTFFSPNSL